jgi:hypothetical protein
MAQTDFVECDPGSITYPDDCPAPGPGSNCGCDWLETFDTYPNGPLTQGTNSWAGWAFDPAVAGTITDEIPDNTSGSGKCLRGDPSPGPGGSSTDQVHWFKGRENNAGEGVVGRLSLGDGYGYDEDVSDFWVMEGYVFLPTDHSGDSFWIMNSAYARGDGSADEPAGGTVWHVQMEMNSNDGCILNSTFAGDCTTLPSLPLLKGQWTKVEVRYNFNLDSVSIFYGDQFLMGYRWSADLGEAPDTLFLGNYDLFNNQGTATYWDDVSIRADTQPPLNPPSLDCEKVELDGNGCTEFFWTLTNENLAGDVSQFYLDIQAGAGGSPGAGSCVGFLSSTTAIEPPAGWTVTACTHWGGGHAMFQFTGGTPIPPGDSVSGKLFIDANQSVEVVKTPFDPAGMDPGCPTNITIPPYMVLISAADLDANLASTACVPGDYSFGPCFAGPGPADQQWTQPARRCEGFIDAPSLSLMTKVVLAMLLIAGGSLLVLRSRRVAA